MTKVKIEFFKGSGKWYEELEFETSTPSFELTQLKKEAASKIGFIIGMNFTLEVSDSVGSWNKYLFLVDIEK